MFKRHLATIVLALALGAPVAHAQEPEHYTVLRQQVTLATTADDDMRPQIAGTVVEASAASTTLAGGAHVPAGGARLGDLATFACQSINDDDPPRAIGCVLLRTQAPAKADQGDTVLW